MTSYSVVYKRFLNSVSDFNLADLDDNTLYEMMNEWLHTAIVNTRTSTNLSCDDENEAFNNDLSNLDIELLAMGMTLAWINQNLNSSELVQQFIGGKEEKYYSQANHINELRSMRADTLREMQRLYTYSTYNNNSYFD